MHACMSSSTLHMHAAHAHAHSNIIPTAGAASPLARGSVEVRLLSGRRAGDYFLGVSEGAQQPPQLELGAQLALSRPSRHALTAPSEPLRCCRAARARRLLQRLTGLHPGVRCHRRPSLRRPLRRPSKPPPLGKRRAAEEGPNRPCRLTHGHNPSRPPLHLPPRHAITAPASPSSDATPLASLAQVSMPSLRRQRAMTGPPCQGSGAPRGPDRPHTVVARSCFVLARAPARAPASVACVERAGRQRRHALRTWSGLCGLATSLRTPYGPQAGDCNLGEPREAPRRFRAGRAWPGGGPGSRWGRLARQRSILGAPVAACTRTSVCMRRVRIIEILSRLHLGESL